MRNMPLFDKQRTMEPKMMEPQMITCFIRYHIDPTKKTQFEQYARNWGEAIPRCGADLIGYFAPHEGSSILAYGIYNIENSPRMSSTGRDFQLIHWAGKTINLHKRKSFLYEKAEHS
jgi:hypothetical protein